MGTRFTRTRFRCAEIKKVLKVNAVSETKSGAGAVAALGRQGELRRHAVSVSGRQGAPVLGAGLMIDRPAPETKSGAGAVAALGRQGELRRHAVSVSGRQGAPVLGAGLMIDRPAPETKSGAGAVAAHGRQGRSIPYP